MTDIKGLGQDIGRLSEIYKIMRRHGFTPDFSPKWWPNRRKKIPLAQPESAAERFTQMLEELGPTFVKVGQLLSTRGDLLPPDFTRALSRLQDRVPPFPFALVKKQVETTLRGPLSDFFSHFEEVPLASASVAQVHVAQLKNGQEVVVKVRRPDIVQQVERDASVIALLAQLLEWIIEEASIYQAVDLTSEFRQALATELDFRIEANQLRQFAKKNAHRPSIYVPQLYPELCGNAVVTMERIHGQRISELPKGTPETKKLVENLVDVAFEHVFVDGLFHADPHPGNIFITQDYRIAFIDFGLMGTMARDEQDRLMAILLALALKDADTLARLLVHLGEPKGRVNIYHFRDTIRRLLDRYSGRSIGDIPAGDALSDLMQASLQFRIKLPKEFALLSKASVTLEGIVRQLHPDLNMTEVLAHNAEKLLFERLDPRNFYTTGKRSALQLLTLVQDLPTQINQTLLDMERGDMAVRVHSNELVLLERTLRWLGLVGFTGMVALGFVMGGFSLISKSIEHPHTLMILGLLSFSTAATLLGLVILWTVTGGRIRKIPFSLIRKTPFLKKFF